MKTISHFLMLSLLCFSIAACSKSETPDTSKVDPSITTDSESPFLAEGEMPKISVSDDNFTDALGDLVVKVSLTNRHGSSVTHDLSVEPGVNPESLDAFYTNACGKNSFVLVVQQELRNAETAGTYFFNALFDPATGEWITTFHGANVKDKDTGQIRSDDQKAILARLKAGITQHCPQILDPNNDKAVEQLLQ